MRFIFLWASIEAWASLMCKKKMDRLPVSGVKTPSSFPISFGIPEKGKALTGARGLLQLAAIASGEIPRARLVTIKHFSVASATLLKKIF
jgi:hypothetical protein